MVGLDTPKSRLTSPTVATPPLRRSTMSRRSGCARALNVSLAIVLTIYGGLRQERWTQMTEHRSGTQEEWKAERDELRKEEKQLTRRGDELTKKRQALPWVAV